MTDKHIYDIEWTPLFADHTPGYILGYTATIKGCRYVTMHKADLRADGYNGTDWQVVLNGDDFEPAPLKAHGTVNTFGNAKEVIANVLDLAVSMGWIPEYRVQA